MLVDLCSDPYKLKCKNEANSSMRGQRLNWDTSEVETIMIYLCGQCCYWNSDWDWDNDPEGPTL